MAYRTDTISQFDAPARTAAPVRGIFSGLRMDKSRLRRVLMIGGVALVAGVSAAFYLLGGRYVTTDDAYIKAAQLMVTTDVSGLVKDVDVHEGQHVKVGEILFRLDRQPFQIALENAKASLASTVQTVMSTRADYRRAVEQANAQQAMSDVAGTTLKRYSSLVADNAIARTLYDQQRATYLSAQSTVDSLKQAAQVDLAKLNGNPNMPVEQSPDYLKAKAAVDEAQRQLDHTVVRAPFGGIVTEVDSLQPGTLVISAMSAFTTTSAVGLISDKNAWVEGNMKETDLTHVRDGQPVQVTVDTYPGCKWQGQLQAVSAASGGAFSPLPAENTSGNWVKVVQRIPVRVKLEKGNCAATLRSGMSANISIDTGRRNWQRLLNG